MSPTFADTLMVLFYFLLTYLIGYPGGMLPGYGTLTVSVAITVRTIK